MSGTIRFVPDGQARWAGMGDFVPVSPDGTHRVELTYVGEPPHGDFYHRATIGTARCFLLGAAAATKVRTA